MSGSHRTLRVLSMVEFAIAVLSFLIDVFK